MYAARTAPSTADVAMEVTTLSAGLGILTAALFPLALPIILLTAAAVIPLLLLALAPVLLVAGVVLPIMLIGRLATRTERALRPVKRAAVGQDARGQRRGALAAVGQSGASRP